MKAVLLTASIAFAGAALGGCVTINVLPGGNPPVTVGEQPPPMGPPAAPQGWGNPPPSYGYAPPAPPQAWSPPPNAGSPPPNAGSPPPNQGRPIGGDLWPNPSAQPTSAAHGPAPARPFDPSLIQ